MVRCDRPPTAPDEGDGFLGEEFLDRYPHGIGSAMARSRST
jgi:hypothetical protein